VPDTCRRRSGTVVIVNASLAVNPPGGERRARDDQYRDRHGAGYQHDRIELDPWV
jgi:hypothetical protein